MTGRLLPISLNKGLDTTGSPLMLEPGTLGDCLNYEMTSHSGYKRIDGYEAYDGWVNGGSVSDYFRTTINISDGTVSAQLTPGKVIYTASTTSASKAIAVVVAYTGNTTTGTLVYVPADPTAPIIPSATGLALTYSTGGVAPTMTSSGTASSGLATDSVSAFMTNSRNYSSILRNAVTTTATSICGLHYFRTNQIVALDCPIMTYIDTTGTKANVVEGCYVSYSGKLYRVITRAASGNNMTLTLEPQGAWSPNVATLKVEGPDSTLTTTAATSVVINASGKSDQAYLLSANSVATSTTRGTTLLNRSTIIQFTGGLAAAASTMVAGGFISIGASNVSYMNVFIKTIVISSGAFSTNNAVGYVEVIGGYSEAGNVNNIVMGQTVRSFNGATKYADIASVTLSKIAGSTAIRSESTMYQWQTYNFYGNESYTEAYGATGASRGFWARAYVDPLTKAPPLGVQSSDLNTNFSWGNIVTDFTNIALDMPRYVSRHGGSLAFGFKGGSVEVSVVGEPRNFDGFNGAAEIATGDQCTGLVEAQSDSLIIFGQRSIHRITGTLPNITLDTVSGSGGAFDYTALLVGSTPVFTGPSGISSLEQSASYGDFTGKRLSYSVSNTLVPLLRPSASIPSLGGTVMALPVRSKDQYRLWLATGQVYVVTLAEDGPKVTISNYGLGAPFLSRDRKGFGLSIQVPFAATSEVADDGREHIVVVWDSVLALNNLKVDGTTSTTPSPYTMYELDTGWGFNGLTFSSYFELSPIYSQDGNSFTSISKVRMQGTGYGIATLQLQSSGIESDYDQAFPTAVQGFSMPITQTQFYRYPSNVTTEVDQSNWGMGIILRVQSGLDESLTTTEPSHTCQVLILSLSSEGVPDL
jgi:hypothetical protein